MNTVTILRQLIRFWGLTNHPVYRAEDRNLLFTPAVEGFRRLVSRFGKPLAAVIFVILMLGLADFLCGAPRRSFATALAQVISFGGGTLILLIILVLTYLWSVAVALTTSSVIVHERERQTWDTLLTTGMEWREILLAKLAAALSALNPYSDVFLWVQAFLIAIIFVLVFGQYDRDVNASANLLQVGLVVLAMLEFGVARLQEYVLAALIGAVASLIAPTKQAAAVLALMGSAFMVLLRAAICGAVLLLLPTTSLPGILILLLTGPASVLAIGFGPGSSVLPEPLRGWLAIAILIGMIVGREGLIRLGYAWTVRHLGEPPSIGAASSE